MKNLLAPACLALPLLAVMTMRTGAPVLGAPQGGPDLEARVSALEGDLKAARTRDDETRALLEKTLAYLEQQSKAGETLTGALDECEKQGFAVGENWRSRQTLLVGLRSYLAQAKEGLPKPPAPEPPKPAAPTRPARR